MRPSAALPLMLALLGACTGGCTVVKLPLAVAQGTVRAVYTGASALVPSGSKKQDPNEAAAKQAKEAAAKDTKVPATSGSSRDRPFNERIANPDRTMAYLPAERSFQAAGGGGPMIREAQTKPFISNRATPVREFQTNPAAGTSRAVPVKDVATRQAPGSERGAAGAERTVATRDVRTRDLPDGGRSASVRGPDPRNAKLFAVKGKRQDALDMQYAPRKPMSVDDVRDLLNKGPKQPEGR